MLGSTSTKNHHAYFTRGIIGLNKRRETAERSYHEETKMNYWNVAEKQLSKHVIWNYTKCSRLCPTEKRKSAMIWYRTSTLFYLPSTFLELSWTWIENLGGHITSSVFAIFSTDLGNSRRTISHLIFTWKVQIRVYLVWSSKKIYFLLKCHKWCLPQMRKNMKEASKSF